MFYIKIKVRSSLIFFTYILILNITITALKIRDILIYFTVPFILYVVYRPTSSFTAYKALFALIAVLTVGGVVLLVSIKWLNLLFSVTIYRNWGFNVTDKASKSSSRLKIGWFVSWYILTRSKKFIIKCHVILKVLY